MSRLRLAAVTASIALVVLAPASAGGGRYGGTLVVGVTQDPGSLDPTMTSTSTSSEIFQAMCLPLYRFTKNHGTFAYVPVLAAALPTPSKDKLSYTVRLRQGIEFNDGTPFNAGAVVATVNRFLTFPGSTAKTSLADVSSVTPSGPYTVVYHLKQRDSTFIASASYVLSPTAIAGNNFAADPICVGPFMFDHRTLGDNVTLVKSPYYYKRGAIHLDKIVFKVISDPAAAAAALEAGDVQVLDKVSTSVLPGVKQDSNLRVLSAPELGWQAVVINMGDTNGIGNPYGKAGNPLAQSPMLRQAFEEAINRQTLNNVVFGGLYQPSCTLVPSANTVWFSLISVPCTGYDPSDARRLVAASGIANPAVHMLNTSATAVLAQFIQAEEAAVGITVLIDTVDNAGETARLNAGAFDTWLGAREPGSPDPHQTIYPLLDTNGDNNYGGYSNPRLDYVLANGLKATQTNARAVDYRVAQQIIHDERPVIVLYNRTSIVAYSASVGGVALDYKGQLQLANAQLS